MYVREVSMVFQESLKRGLRDFFGCFNKVSITGNLKWVSRAFDRSSKGISGKFQTCLKEVSRVPEGSFKGFSRKFQGCFNGVVNGFKCI